jgi:hypothetical protein
MCLHKVVCTGKTSEILWRKSIIHKNEPNIYEFNRYIKPNKNGFYSSRIGYKFFFTNAFGSIDDAIEGNYSIEYNTYTNISKISKDWNQASDDYIQSETQIYKSGFHIFLRLKDLYKYMQVYYEICSIYMVEYRNIVSFGYETVDKSMCVVAQEMRLLDRVALIQKGKIYQLPKLEREDAKLYLVTELDDKHKKSRVEITYEE